MLYRKTPYLCMIYIILTFMFIHILVAIWEKFNDLVGRQSPIIIYWPPDQNIQCYNQVTNDALKSVEDPDFSPQSKSIFFHETSCRGGIDSREACAVESAARANPDWEVYLLFTAPVTDVMVKRSCLVKLLKFPNVKLGRIHAYSYSKHTAVSQIVSHKLAESSQPVQHSADIMKILTLNKWGGISLDLDMPVMKSFSNLPNNWIAKEAPAVLASGVMRFSKDEVGKNLTSNVLREIAATYNAESWSFNGACAIERVLMRRCKNVLKRNGDCGGISIFGQEWFYPIQMKNAHSLLKEGSSSMEKVTWIPYTYCMWNIMTSMVQVHQKSAYVRMAKKVCPTIYHTFGDEFGV